MMPEKMEAKESKSETLNNASPAKIAKKGYISR